MSLLSAKPAMSLPLALDSALKAMLMNHNVSSWKIASEGQNPTVVLRLKPNRPLQDGERWHTDRSEAYRRKTPSQIARDRRRVEEYRQRFTKDKEDYTPVFSIDRRDVRQRGDYDSGSVCVVASDNGIELDDSVDRGVPAEESVSRPTVLCAAGLEVERGGTVERGESASSDTGRHVQAPVEPSPAGVLPVVGAEVRATRGEQETTSAMDLRDGARAYGGRDVEATAEAAGSADRGVSEKDRDSEASKDTDCTREEENMNLSKPQPLWWYFSPLPRGSTEDADEDGCFPYSVTAARATQSDARDVETATDS